VPNIGALAFTFVVLFVSLAGAQEEPVVDLGPGVTPPRVTHQVSPVNRPDARGFRISGTVLIGLVVSSQGEPKEIHVIRSLDKDVDQSAVEAVQQWHFEAAKQGDKPVAVRITVEIRFHSM
jgi:TonB family protein